MNDYDSPEVQAHQSKRLLMAFGLHFLLFTGFFIGLDFVEYNAPFSLSAYIDPQMLFYPISIIFAGLLYLAFEKISVWVWVAASVLTPILFFAGIFILFVLFAEPSP